MTPEEQCEHCGCVKVSGPNGPCLCQSAPPVGGLVLLNLEDIETVFDQLKGSEFSIVKFAHGIAALQLSRVIAALREEAADHGPNKASTLIAFAMRLEREQRERRG